MADALAWGMRLWQRLIGRAGGEPPTDRQAPAPPDDPASLPWAQPSLMWRAGLRLPRAPWARGDRPDPDEEAAQRMASWAQAWWQAPHTAAGLGIPRPSREEIVVLHRDWPDLCRGHNLPPAEAWEEAQR